jgi:Tol biopolymer transport system component
MPENQSTRGRLDSWKEIADYLKRDTRTAIRWEKDRGLPVHRVPGGKRQAVFAYPHEIDAWLDSQDINGSSPVANSRAEVSVADEHSTGIPIMIGHGASQSAENGDAESEQVGQVSVDDNPQHDHRIVPERLPHLNKWKLAVASAAFLGLGLASSFVLTRPRDSVASHILNPRQITADGLPKMGFRTDGTTLYLNIEESDRTILISEPMSGTPMRPIDTPFANVILQDLSNDGKTLLVTSHEGIEHEGPLWTIPVHGGIPNPMGGAQCNEARWSPDNSKVACALRTTLSLLDADGSNARMLAPFSSPVTHLIWSPDGRRLRFALRDVTQHTYSPWEIAVSQEGTNPTPVPELPKNGSCCVDWVWLQDGKTLVYVTLAADGEMHLMMQAGGSTREIQLPAKARYPGGLVRAKDIVYLEIGNVVRGEMLKFDEKRGEFLTFRPGLSTYYLAFSPDGQWIAYANAADNTLWRSRVDGSEALQLTTSPMEVQVSSWSPDGQRIAFMARNPGEPYRIYLVDRNGGAAKQASAGNDNQGGPSWAPNGKEIVYGNVFGEETHSGLIRRIDLVTGKVQIISGSNDFRTARWSLDGNYIAALRWQTRELILYSLQKQRWKTLAGSITGDSLVWSSDSRFIYADSPRQEKPVVVRVRVKDGQRTTVVNLAALQKVPAGVHWVGLTPDNSVVFLHMFTSSEIYELK